MVTDAIAPYHRGGKEQRYAEIAPRLGAYASVRVYTMKWWEGPATIERDGVTYQAITPLLPLYRHGRRSVRQAIVFAIACARLLFCPFDAIEADHMPYLQLFVLKAVTLIKRKRLVVTWHEVWGAAAWQAYIGRAGRAAWWIERASMRLPDVIVAASPETAQRLRRFVPERVSIISAPNGIDVASVASVPATRDVFDVVSVGRMIRHKRFDLLLDAIAILARDGLELRCQIVGDGPEREALELQAHRLGISERITIKTAIIAHDEVLSLVKGARAFVLPSEREGFGIAALEALACGVPVITTSCPDNLSQHLVRRSRDGVVCEHTAAALAVALERICTHARDDRAVDEWVAEYDWSKTVDRVASALLGDAIVEPRLPTQPLGCHLQVKPSVEETRDCAPAIDCVM
ncbi:MAG: glycosyltransferase [Solirubrobacteraceae bacterium]